MLKEALPPELLILHSYPKESTLGGGQWTEVKVSPHLLSPRGMHFGL